MSDGKGSSRQLQPSEGGRGAEGKGKEFAPTEDDREAWETEKKGKGKSKL